MMAAADYALCDSCVGKVFYDANTDIPAGTVIMHPDCAVKELAKVRAEGYRQAIADLREDSAFREWFGRAGDISPGQNGAAADFLESRITGEGT